MPSVIPITGAGTPGDTARGTAYARCDGLPAGSRGRRGRR
jgi:hypothetical protein